MTQAFRRIATAIAVCLVAQATGRTQVEPVQTQTDEYVRYDLSPPASSSFHVSFEVSATTENTRRYTDPIQPGTTVTGVTATDVMTGQPLTVTQNATLVTVALARLVPKNGQGRIRIDKTIKDPRGYIFDGKIGTFTTVLPSRRGVLALPAGFELIACNVASQVLSLPDGRISIAFMNQAPGPRRSSCERARARRPDRKARPRR